MFDLLKKINVINILSLDLLLNILLCIRRVLHISKKLLNRRTFKRVSKNQRSERRDYAGGREDWQVGPTCQSSKNILHCVLNM